MGMEKKIISFVSFGLISILSGFVFFFPTPARACDILETLLVEGIMTTRVRTTSEPCAPESAKLPGLVLPSTIGPISPPPPATPEGGTNAIGETGPVDLTGSSNNTGREDPSSLAVAGEIGDCGDPSSSGGLGRAVNEAMRDIGGRLGDTVWSETLRGLRRSGEAGRILSDIFRDGIRDVAGELGERGSQAAGDYVEGQVQDLFGDSRLGRAAGRIIGDAAGDLTEQYSQQAIDGLIEQTGLGDIGGLFGGSGGNPLTSIIGGGNGIGSIVGGSVPVQDSGVKSEIKRTAEQTDSILSATRVILDESRKNQEVLLKNECVIRPLTARLVTQALEEGVARDLKAGAELTVVNIAEFERMIRDGEAEYFIEELSRTGQTELAEKLYAYYSAQVNPTEPDCKENSSNPIERLQMIGAYPESCTKSGREAKAIEDLKRLQTEAVRRAKEMLADGVRPGGGCVGQPEVTRIEDCHPQSAWYTNLTAAQVAAQTERALATSRDRLIAGEVISDAFNDLLDEVFSTLGDEIEGGIRGLASRRGSNRNAISRSGAPTPSGSYIDQLTGTTLTGRERSDLVTQNIATAASVESQYQTIIRTKIANLEGAASAFRNLHVCYQTLANGTPTAITKEEALRRMNNASSTVAAVFTPQIAEQNRLLSISAATASRLQGLASQAAGETNTQNLRAIANAYQEMVDAHLTHTTSELQALSDDMAGDADALLALREDAGVQLTTCQAIH